MTPGFELNSTEDLAGHFTDRFQRALMKFVLSSEDELTFLAEHSAETIPEPFPIFRELSVSPGNYENRSVGLNFVTKPGRSVSMGLLTTRGDFYDGNRTHMEPSVRWKIDKHFTLAQFVSVDRIHLPDETFTLQLFRTRVDYSLNTHLSVASLIQYDNSSQEFGLNLRLSYLFREGTELFVVYDEIADDRIVPRIEKRVTKEY